jgi:DNA-binding MarR family transcriptional regulator
MQDAISNVATYLDTQSPLDTEAGIALKDSQAIETHGPGFMIRRLQQVSVSFFHDELRPLSLTPLQATVLRALGKEDGLDQVSLASRAVVDTSTIKDVVHRLEQNKAVKRKQSSADKRMKIVELTATGRKLLLDSVPLANIAADRLLAPLTERERQQLLKIIAKIVTAHDPVAISGVRTTWRRKKTDLQNT